MEEVKSEIIPEAEWVFQFNDSEPVVFAVTPIEALNQPLSTTIVVDNRVGSSITFATDDNVFSLYARPITDVGRKFRQEESKNEG